jgi:hypothetical protein
MNWHIQQSSRGINIRATDIKVAANTMTKNKKIQFKASDGWFW